MRFDAARGKRFEQCFVDPFDRVVALLVVAIDRALDLGDALVADVGAAGDVFLVPEQVVELVLFADDRQESGVRIVHSGVVPAADSVAVQLGDLLDQLLGRGPTSCGNSRRAKLAVGGESGGEWGGGF